MDVAGDYQSLFKPALLATKPSGGRIIATNHVATVEFDAWVEKNQGSVERARSILGEIASADSFDLAILSVALRVIRTLLRTNSM